MRGRCVARKLGVDDRPLYKERYDWQEKECTVVVELY